MNFFLSELGSEGSQAGDQLTIKNRLQQKNVESLFKKYITEYVQCQLCKSQKTILEKDKQTRLEILQCENCKSQRSVAPIGKKGWWFKYTIRIILMSSYSRRKASLPVMVFEEFKIPRRRAPSVISKNSDQESINPASSIEAKPESSSRYYNKNAFRYICRIALKEGYTHEFHDKVVQICAKNSAEIDQVLRVFSKAETVSGPRYFQHMM